MTRVQPDLDPTPGGRFATPAEQAAEMRRPTASPDVMLGSVHTASEWTPDRVTVVLCDKALGF